MPGHTYIPAFLFVMLSNSSLYSVSVLALQTTDCRLSREEEDFTFPLANGRPGPSSSQYGQLETNGFVLLPNALTPQEVDDVRHVTDGLFKGTLHCASKECMRRRDQRPNGNAGFSLKSLVNLPHETPYTSLLEAPRNIATSFFDQVESKMEFEFAGHADLQANTTKGWHRDSPHAPDPWMPFDGDEHKLYRLILYLEDHSEDDGALLVIPGSHLDRKVSPPKIQPGQNFTYDLSGRHVALARDDAKDPAVHVLRPAKGDALLIDHRTYHRGGDMAKPRALIQYSVGQKGNAFTDSYRESSGDGIRGERYKCLPAMTLCVCYDVDIDNAACGRRGCGHCGGRRQHKPPRKHAAIPNFNIFPKRGAPP
eukprot:gnl/TRDRNA2_/TRDRNA2_54008_c0_seq1.p1 gnl/TRDRNA2_/TRDRNA2_54008_c0~~gnl/TRDRNA2_/TRDRNA2_54008_c0_seq1.p1  ORF type:complete len:378 (+),score=17.90 gnl/TRDRNA2_/TRDRNA2_54008_c0_seq1:34-1134(+)